MTARDKAADAATRGDLMAERFWLSVAETVDQAPPLCPEQVTKLRVLIASDSVPQSTAA
ncbi:hypothetical protein [Streptomyces sp. NPDC058108]|uniref:hypothetical protein n=1 Tax=Streptomyces sp. NPDC058108 TaxID=3346344 RepID=UPI0036E8B4CC